MNPAPARTTASNTVVFRDEFGERRRVATPSGTDTLDVLCFRNDLTSVPSFEFALRERVSRLASFRHAYFARVRTVERLSDSSRTLALISDATPGVRLSDLLACSAHQQVVLDVNAALCLIRQITPALAALHKHAPGVAHGAIGPERIIVSPSARIVIVEQVLGAAVEQLRFSEERYWKELRVPATHAAGLPVFDQRADVMQLGMIALALILGRPLTAEEFPGRIAALLASASAMSADGDVEPVPAGLRSWLARALQVDSRDAFSSAIDAQDDLAAQLGPSDYLVAPLALEAFLARYNESKEERAAPAPSAARPQVVAPTLTVCPPVEPERPVRAVRPPPPAEVAPAPAVKTVPPVRRRFASTWKAAAAAGIVLSALAGGGVLASRRFASPPPVTGTLAVKTNPAGAEVIVDGQSRGVSPIALTLTAGPHVLELRGTGEPRTFSLNVAAGAELAQYIELAKSEVLAGSVLVRTEPAGARVTIDGVPRGTSPLTVPDLLPGEHAVVLQGDTGPMTQTVKVEAGATASLIVQLPVAPGGPVSGWISVSAPKDVQIFEGGQLLGTSETERLMVPVGTHHIELVNDLLGYRSSRTVQVAGGKVASITVEFPKGTIAINAVPWAEVWVDGEKVGETPIGNLPVTVGSHEIIFRHPELGERRQVANITTSAPARVSVDMRKP